MKKTVYLSGGITNNPNYERIFARAEMKYSKLGFNVYNPVKLGKKLDDTYKRINANNNPTYKDYLEFDLEFLLEADSIIMLNGWECSLGAKAEYHYALACGIEVIFDKN